jgi:hypothetical protein
MLRTPTACESPLITHAQQATSLGIILLLDNVKYPMKRRRAEDLERFAFHFHHTSVNNLQLPLGDEAHTMMAPSIHPSASNSISL